MAENKTQSERNAKWRSTGRSIPRPPCAHPAVRKRLEKDTAAWLRHYLTEAYPLPFGAVHHEMIDGAETTLTGGGKEVVVAPRGSAKSTVFWGVCLKWVLSGETPFPAYLPWKTKELRKALRFWRTALCFNDRLADDYPEFCAPFAASRGSSQKCKTLTWEETGEPTGAELLVSEGMIVMPDSRGVIGSSTINGNPRGMNHTAENGKVWRPSAALIDDAQSKEAAKSASQVESIIDIIETDIAGMAGPTARMPMFLLGTISRAGDVVDYFTKQRDWKCVKVAQITAWPKRMDLWAQFGEMIEDQREPEARKLYKANKAAMLEGFAVSWEHRYDKKRKEPDAFYSAMRDFYFLGKAAFMAERQGEPVEESTGEYSLTPEIVMAHTFKGMPRLHLPEKTTVFTGHIDINRSKGGLHWTVAGFDQAMTCHIPAYGHYPDRGDLWPESASQQVIQQSIFAGLKAVCDRIAATQFVRAGAGVSPSLILIDASFESDTVHRFAAWANASRLYPFKVLPAIGRAAHLYWFRKDSIIGRPFEGGHIQRGQSSPSKIYAMINKDYWMETAQRAWLGPVGAAGGCTLYDADPREHAAFAAQACAEKIHNKYDTPKGQRWEWRHAPGAQWDWGDTIYNCWAAAASCGLSASGTAEVIQKKAAVVFIGKPRSR